MELRDNCRVAGRASLLPAGTSGASLSRESAGQRARAASEPAVPGPREVASNPSGPRRRSGSAASRARQDGRRAARMGAPSSRHGELCGPGSRTRPAGRPGKPGERAWRGHGVRDSPRYSRRPRRRRRPCRTTILGYSPFSPSRSFSPQTVASMCRSPNTPAFPTPPAAATPPPPHRSTRAAGPAPPRRAGRRVAACRVRHPSRPTCPHPPSPRPSPPDPTHASSPQPISHSGHRPAGTRRHQHPEGRAGRGGLAPAPHARRLGRSSGRHRHPKGRAGPGRAGPGQPSAGWSAEDLSELLCLGTKRKAGGAAPAGEGARGAGGSFLSPAPSLHLSLSRLFL